MGLKWILDLHQALTQQDVRTAGCPHSRVVLCASTLGIMKLQLINGLLKIVGSQTMIHWRRSFDCLHWQRSAGLHTPALWQRGVSESVTGARTMFAIRWLKMPSDRFHWYRRKATGHERNSNIGNLPCSQVGWKAALRHLSVSFDTEIKSAYGQSCCENQGVFFFQNIF